MNPTESPAVPNSTPLAHAALGPGTGLQRDESLATASADKARRIGYGMPCLKCKTYYAADLVACPVCQSTERVSPMIASVPVVSTPEVRLPDPAEVEEERERFLREFKAQLQVGDMQINASASFRCSNEENHEGAFEAAAVCQGCYEHLREQVDLLNAALHMDLRDATQVIYDAVWANPSDPGKTYQNAAQALLNELHRRAGISPVLGPLQPLAH